MKNRTNIAYLLGSFVLIACTGFNTFAQEDTLKSKEDIVIVKGYKPTVSDAYKITSTPNVENTEVPEPEIKYTTLKKQITTNFEIEPIKPARLKGEPLSKLSKAYVKGGVGNYANTMFEAYVNNSRSRKHSVGVYAKHFASQGGINDVGPNNMSSNAVSLYGKKFLKQHLVSGGVGYNRDVIHYYGYDPEMETHLTKDNTKQWFSKPEASLQFTSFYKDSSKVNFDLGLNYYNLIDKDGRMENYGRMDYALRKFSNPNWSDFVNNEVITVNGFLDYNHFANAVSAGGSLFNFNPQIVSRGEKWKLDFGINTFLEIADNTGRFHFYPSASAKYNVFRNMLIPYVGINGGIKRNNYGSIADENPFVNYNTTALNTKTRFNLYGGVRGAFSSKMAFNIQASKKRVDNFMMYVNDYNVGVFYDDVFDDFINYRWGGNKFTPIFDTANITTIEGELSYILTDRINVIAKGAYYRYQLNNEVQPWHKPEWEASITANYAIKNKFIVELNLFALGSQKARVYEGSVDDFIGSDQFDIPMYTTTINPLVDLSLGLEYRYTKKLSAFVNFNNVLGMNYNRWYKYPTQGFNVLGGLKYSFWKK